MKSFHKIATDEAVQEGLPSFVILLISLLFGNRVFADCFTKKGE